ncbi:MAG: hypothetical protein ISS66_10135 [Desulfobacteraceae bacterium]|nr:hypothetical protein [Desulfobacteraceae bacterium]
MRNANIFLKIMGEKGVSIVALVIVLLLMSSLGFVLASLIATKQSSAPLPLQSTQAFYVAQAGIEYAIRYTFDHQSEFWVDPANIFPVTKSVGAGSFNVTYDAGDKSITSTGTAGTAKRVITLSSFFSNAYADDGDYPQTGTGVITLASFTSFVAGGVITIAPGNSPYQGGPPFGGNQKHIYIPTANDTDYVIHIFKIDMAKEGGKQARLNEIKLADTTVWTGNKVSVSTNPDSPTAFSFNQVGYYTMGSGALLDRIAVQATSEVSGTWYLTFHYSKQTELSSPETSKVKFVVP